jgi:hypothetical protein
MSRSLFDPVTIGQARCQVLKYTVKRRVKS